MLEGTTRLVVNSSRTHLVALSSRPCVCIGGHPKALRIALEARWMASAAARASHHGRGKMGRMAHLLLCQASAHAILVVFHDICSSQTCQQHYSECHGQEHDDKKESEPKFWAQKRAITQHHSDRLIPLGVSSHFKSCQVFPKELITLHDLTIPYLTPIIKWGLKKDLILISLEGSSLWFGRSEEPDSKMKCSAGCQCSRWTRAARAINPRKNRTLKQYVLKWTSNDSSITRIIPWRIIKYWRQETPDTGPLCSSISRYTNTLSWYCICSLYRYCTHNFTIYN